MPGKSSLGAIAQEPVRAEVLQRIRDAIIRGDLPPGSPLRIDRLSADLGVSHMPVREALHVLTVEGLAVRLPRRGVRVSALNEEDVRHAYEVMAVMEGLAGRAAAQHLDDGAIAGLHRLLLPSAGLLAAGDAEGLMRINRSFHGHLYEACRNRWVNTFCGQLWNYVYRLRRRHPQSQRRLAQSVAEHAAILEAVAARDADRVEVLIRQHCVRSRDDLLEQVAKGAMAPSGRGPSPPSPASVVPPSAARPEGKRP